ncbi:MAG: CHC2 zinc finger domain-containing protein [Lachnospiraceae bacterium]|nr:CHC2 zinc finger domain-containing protein [Lachnospiraceae bacterium]
MTVEMIKDAYSMTHILGRYGIKVNRAGFANCPFHNEKTSSMKVYTRDYHCFGCGSNGDIFTFVQLIDGIDFKDAFYSLGGTYDKPTYKSQLLLYRANKKKERRQIEEARLRQKRRHNNMLISIYRHWMNVCEPLSDVWCDSYNALQLELYRHEILSREEVVSCDR